MAKGDLPNGTAGDEPLTFGEGVNDITNLLSGLDDDVLNPGGPEGQEQADDEVEGDEAPAEDQLQLEDDEVDTEEATAEPADEDPAPRGGAFVPDTGKVTMPDGTVLSVADLKRDHLYQRDYTRKTTELSSERKQVEEDKAFVAKHAEAVAQQRQTMAAFMEKYLPKAPSADLARTDPYAYGVQKAEYDDKMGVLNQLHHANMAAMQQQQEQYQTSLAEVKRTEAAKLFELKPMLRDQKKFAEWYGEAGGLMMEKYGFTAEEVNEATDHRFYLMMDDLKQLHAARARMQAGKKPGKQAAQQQNGRRPTLLQGSSRNAPPPNNVQRQRQVFTERLKKSGSLEDARRKLETFDL